MEKISSDFQFDTSNMFDIGNSHTLYKLFSSSGSPIWDTRGIFWRES